MNLESKFPGNHHTVCGLRFLQSFAPQAQVALIGAISSEPALVCGLQLAATQTGQLNHDRGDDPAFFVVGLCSRVHQRELRNNNCSGRRHLELEVRRPLQKTWSHKVGNT